MSETFRTEKILSCQIPAIELLINLGYHYVTPEQDNAWRRGRSAHGFLDDILQAQLNKNNFITYLTRRYPFNDSNILTAIERLKTAASDGLQRGNATLYKMLTLGISLEQTMSGDTKSHTLHYIDWEIRDNNVFHVAAGFEVERNRSRDTARADLVLFVNGIPFAVIECAAPELSIEEPIARMLRNQGDDYIPNMFASVQMVLALNRNQARYACVGTHVKSWSKWHEDIPEACLSEQLLPLIQKDLGQQDKAALFDFAQKEHQRHVTPFELEQERSPYANREQISTQDQTLYALCRPERLLELAYAYTVFNGGQRQIARYHQYFAVQRAMARVREIDENGRRGGGIVWHAQGTGKSLTMVMLARQLALASDIPHARIVIITDQKDIAANLGSTFEVCSMHPEEARSLSELFSLIGNPKRQIITSRAHRFARAASQKKHFDESAEIFILVDESHQHPLGVFASEMRRTFPRLCYIGFTGTPLTHKERQNVIDEYGNFIDVYPTDKAIDEHVVLPVLYEARNNPLDYDPAAIKLWFERHAQVFCADNKPGLQELYARAEKMDPEQQRCYLTVLDISAHFLAMYKGTGLKGQLVAPDKYTALTYKRAFSDIGYVTSALLIFSPKTHEGLAIPDQEQSHALQVFWGEMMARFGNEEDYNDLLIEQYLHAAEPEILIVVDKCLANFNAPQNAVLYLTRPLSGHALLQTIARVNRLFDGANRKDEQERKPFGCIIDYTGMLGTLERNLTLYPELQEFNEPELRGILIGADLEIKKLPQLLASLWEIFRDVANREDQEHLERVLGDKTLRIEFHTRLANYTRTLEVALGNDNFLMHTPDGQVRAYEQDLCRFHQLKTSATLRFGENLNFQREYTPKIAKLLNPIGKLRHPTQVNIFHEKSFDATLREYGLTSTAAKADAGAFNTRTAIRERLAQEPTFYKIYAKRIQQVIEDYRARLFGDVEYLVRVTEIKDAVVHHKLERIPVEIQEDENAMVLYGAIHPVFESATHNAGILDAGEIGKYAAQAAQKIAAIIAAKKKTVYRDDDRILRETENGIDDFLYDTVQKAWNINVPGEQKTELIKKLMRLAHSYGINHQE